jgi:hypothetical protein
VGEGGGRAGGLLWVGGGGAAMEEESSQGGWAAALNRVWFSQINNSLVNWIRERHVWCELIAYSA